MKKPRTQMLLESIERTKNKLRALYEQKETVDEEIEARTHDLELLQAQLGEALKSKK